MKLKQLPITKILLISTPSLDAAKASAELRLIPDVVNMVIVRSSPAKKVTAEEIEEAELIIIEGSYHKSGACFEDAVSMLVLLTEAEQLHKTIMISQNTDLWEKTTDTLDIPLVTTDRIMAGIGEYIMEQRELLKKAKPGIRGFFLI